MKNGWSYHKVNIELVRELVIGNMQNKFEQDTCESFEVIAPTR